MSGGDPLELARYIIDPGLSRFTARAFASGMLSAFGHNPTVAILDFSGYAQFAPAVLEGAALEGGELHLKINAGSLTVTGDMSEKDRREIERTMNDDMLEVNRYPEIVFDSSMVSATSAGAGYYRVELTGNLSLHGVTNKQDVPTQVIINGDTLTARGEFSVKQTAYAIRPVTVAGGALKLKDELKLQFDIVARRQPN